MSQNISYFSRNKTVLLFLFLEFIAFVFIINNHSFHYSKFLNSSNFLSGSILNKINSTKDYFSLRKQNNALLNENEILINRILINEKQESKIEINQNDSLIKYQYIQAKVISNPYSKRNNILTLNKGTAHGIQADMGVVLPNGVIGITLDVSKNYTTVLSILHSQSNINAKIKKSHHYGSLHWNGEDFTKISLDDIPIQANIQKGDTIISGGKSVFFPEGIPIGTITEYNIDNKAYGSIVVDLFLDMSSLFNVYVVNNIQKEEQLELEKQSLDE